MSPIERLHQPTQSEPTAGIAGFRLGLLSAYNEFEPWERNLSIAFLRKLEKSGWERPSKCVACSEDRGIIDMHMEDYSRPFDTSRFIPLCLRCHIFAVHSRHLYPRQTEVYRERVRRGFRAPPIFVRNLGLVIHDHVGRSDLVAWEFVSIPSRFILDEIAAGLLCPPGRVSGNAPARPNRSARTRPIPSLFDVEEATTNRPTDRPKVTPETKESEPQTFLERITDWRQDNILIEYPDGTTNKDPEVTTGEDTEAGTGEK